MLPIERVLIETDSPSMLGPPETWSDEQSLLSDQQHPMNIVKVAECFSQLRGESYEALGREVFHNFQRFFSMNETLLL